MEMKVIEGEWGSAFVNNARQVEERRPAPAEVTTTDICTAGGKVLEVCGIVNESGNVDVPEVVIPISANPRANLPA